MLSRLILAAAMVAALCWPASAQVLFKDHSHGATRLQLLAIEGAYQCEPNVVCIDGQTFLGEPVGLGFVLVGDALQQVIVDLSEAEDPYNRILLAVAKSGQWLMISAQSPQSGAAIDLVDHVRRGDTAALTTFEQGAIAAGAIGYTFVELTPATQVAVAQATSVADLIRDLPQDTRFVDFVLSDPDETYYMRFYLGLLELRAPGVPLEKF